MNNTKLFDMHDHIYLKKNFVACMESLHIFNMKKIWTILLVSFLSAFNVVNAKSESKITMYGGVINSLTYRYVLNVGVYLMRADSTIVDSTRTVDGEMGKLGRCGFFILRNVPGNGKYILCFKHPRYEIQYEPIEVNVKSGTSFDVEKLIHLTIKRPMKTLGEARVKATLVKFYLKNDTLVYNADAFQTEEGSLLDALIRQLPGVQLKDNGEIYVNGRKVEELLLNGKDFFRGDNRVMLDNLPAYMVKDVKVYERQSDVSTYLKQDVDRVKPYVMDVCLKRQYSVGIVGNTEVAAGTKERYLARLFAMRFTPQSRMAVFGTMNNQNDDRKPGENGEWSPTSLSGGLTATRKAGIDYRVDDKTNLFKVNGNAEIEYQNTDLQSFSNSVNFLSGGDTYGLSNRISRSKNVSFQTSHTLQFPKFLYLSVTPNFSYHNIRDHSSLIASTLFDNTYNDGHALLDSIYLPNFGERIRRLLINRNRVLGLGRSHDYTFGGMLSSFFTLFHLPMSFSSSGNYSKAQSRSFNWQQTDFPNASTNGLFRNQYFDVPYNSYDYKAEIEVIKHLRNNFDVRPIYSFSQDYSSRYRNLYSLDRLGDESLLPFGALPSTHDSLLVALDGRNTYQSESMNNKHTLDLFLKKEGYLKGKNYWWFRIHLPVNFYRNRINYLRDKQTAFFSRHYVEFEPQINVEHMLRADDGTSMIMDKFNTNREVSAPSLTYLIPWLVDDSDPLNIFKGTANLNRTQTYRISYQHTYFDMKKGINMNYDLNYVITQNAIAQGSAYDKGTGVRTTTPDNVNGNWSVFGGYFYSLPLDKKHQWTLSTFTIANYTNSVDLIGDGGNTVVRSDVHNVRLTEILNAGVQLGKMQLGTTTEASWFNATSSRSDFKTVNVENFKYGLTCKYKLPLNFNVATDLMMYSRRGYEDNNMNTNDLVWNARLSKSLLKNHVQLAIEGFDLLHNLSNVTRSLNVQGRVETYTNVIPSYVMFHCIYRIDIKPKKRPGDE